MDDALRQQQMQRVNSAIVPRNWLAQRAIDAAEQGDMAEPGIGCMKFYVNLFGHRSMMHYASRPPEWGKRLRSVVIRCQQHVCWRERYWLTVVYRPEFCATDTLTVVIDNDFAVRT